MCIRDSIMPRLYREAPLNSIWEGSGNVMCLDVLRALQRDNNALPALFKELDSARGSNSNFDANLMHLKSRMDSSKGIETEARLITEKMACLIQASIFIKSGQEEKISAFCNSRLGPTWSGAFGTLSEDTNFEEIIRSF